MQPSLVTFALAKTFCHPKYAGKQTWLVKYGYGNNATWDGGKREHLYTLCNVKYVKFVKCEVDRCLESSIK